MRFNSRLGRSAATPLSTKQSEIVSILKGLEKVGELEGSALISRDGLVIAANLPSELDRETFSAMSATMVAAAETAAFEMRRGAPARVIVETPDLKMLALGASSETVLVGLAGARSNVGLLLSEMGKAAERVRAVVGE